MLQEKGVRIAMAAGKGKYSTEISLKHFELTHFFEIIETGSPTGPRKAEGIQQISETFNGFEKAEVIYVGDAPSDIWACKKVGIPIIAAAWAETAKHDVLEQLQPDCMFFTVQDFASWLIERI
jgi:phosphoglycolate phosphatase/pyrophosphatase PpaX